VAAVRAAYSDARLIAVFEPRTNTSRQKFFQRDYSESFVGADYVVVREPPDPEKFGAGNRFSSKQLALDISAQGGSCRAFARTGEIIDFLIDLIRPGDVVLIMSNGGFDNIHEKLLTALAGN
jgi:UDP-N-acetylmuramate: L-alanyl-gamma-D-glutamyl-meso-diaminopimelate ligase